MNRSAQLSALPSIGVALLVLLFLTICLASIHNKSATYDEAAHLEVGDGIFTGKMPSPIMQRMAISALNVVPGFLIEKLGLHRLQKHVLLMSRTPTMLAAAMLAVFVFLWSRRLYGTRAGFFSLVLFVFCPNVIAHSRLITNDIYAACFMFVATYLFVRYLKAGSVPRQAEPAEGCPLVERTGDRESGEHTSAELRYLVLSAFVTGCAQISKHTALCLLPTFLALYVLSHWIRRRNPGTGFHGEARPSPGRTCAHVLLFLLIVLFVINAGYGFRGTFEIMGVPLPSAYREAFLFGLEYNATGQGHFLNYLLGERSPDGFWYYYIVCLLLKTPIPVLVLGIGTLALLKDRFHEHTLDETVFVLVPVGLFCAFSFLSTCQIGIRYLLPAFPFVYTAMGKLAAHSPPRHRRSHRTCLALLLVWFVGSSLSFHPHYISYVNELILDRKDIVKYLADSNVDWGQNDRYVEAYIQAWQGPEQIHFKPDGPVNDGIVVVSVNDVAGIDPRHPTKYDWLKDYHESVAHVAYSWLVYRISSASEILIE